MNLDYSRPPSNPSENVRSSLPSYYLERPSHLGLSRPQPPFESIQMLDNFVNKKRKHDSSSHKSMQFPPNSKFFVHNVPQNTKKTTTHQDKKNIRSVSRPKSGENLQTNKSLHQSRSSNSLSAAKNTPEPVQVPKTTSQVPKQTLSPHMEQSAQSRYPLPKGKQEHVIDRDVTRLRKPSGPNKQNIKNIQANQGIKQQGGSYFYNDGPGMQREDPGSITFPSFRSRNFSHNNSVHHDNSHFQLTLHEDPSSSEFNFESPIPTTRGAQEEEFIKLGHSRFSPMVKKTETQKDTVSPVKKNKIFYNVEIDRRLERDVDRAEHEGNSVVITKGSMDLSQSRGYGKNLGLENFQKGQYENEVFQSVGYSSFNVAPDVSTKATNPTHRAKANQSNIVFLGDSVDHQNASQTNLDMLGTSHFNSNAVFVQPEKDETPPYKQVDNSRYNKDQYKLLSEFTAKYEDKRTSMGSHPIGNIQQQQQQYQEKKLVAKPTAKPKVGSVQISKVSSTSGQAGALNKSPQPQPRKISPKNRPITEPNNEKFFQSKYTLSNNPPKREPSHGKMDKVYESQQDINKLKIFPVNRKKENNSITPHPSSRNTRTKSDIQSMHTKSHEKPKYLNIKKVRDSKKQPTSEYSAFEPFEAPSVMGTLGERIRNQTILNADRERLEKHHAKSQSVVFQESHNKSVQGIGLGVNEMGQGGVVRKSHNQSQEYYGDFPMQMREDGAKKMSIPRKENRIFDGLETFNQQGKQSVWEIQGDVDDVVEPVEGMGHHEVQERNRNIFEFKVPKREVGQQGQSDESFRGARGLNQLLSREDLSGNRRDVRKEQQGMVRSNISRDREVTSRSIIERQQGSSVVEGKDEREDSIVYKGDRMNFLSMVDMQMSVDSSGRKMSSAKKPQPQSPNKTLRLSLGGLYEFKMVASWEGHRNTVTKIVGGPSRTTILSASRDNTVREWSMRELLGGFNTRSSDTERENSRVVIRDKKAIECLMCNSMDGLVFSGGADKEIRITNSTTWEPITRLKGHSGGVFSLANLGRNALLSCSGDQTIKRWDMHTGSCVQTWREHSNRVTSVLYDREKFAHSFLSCSVDGKIKVWDIRVSESVATFSDHDLDVTSLAYVGTQCHFGSGSLDKTVKIWDLNMRTMLQNVEIGSPVYSLEYYGKTDKVIVGSDNIKAICIEDNFNVQTVGEDHKGSIRSLFIDNELDLLFTGSADCEIKAWFLNKTQ